MDDDNWLDANYLDMAHRIMTSHPEIGVLGGLSQAAFEVSPPDWFGRVQSLFGCGAQALQPGDITETKPHVIGAGMIMRKHAYIQLRDSGFRFLLDGRTSRRLSSGEDTELCFGLALQGWRIRYDDRLRLGHFMPSARLSKEYVFRLARGIARSAPVISCYEAAYLGLSPSPTRIYLRNLWRRSGWMAKALVKFLLGRSDFVLLRIEALGLWEGLSSYSDLWGAFSHYERIRALDRR